MPVTSVARKKWPLVFACALALLGVIVFRMLLKWDGLTLTVRLQDLSGLLAPLAFASAVIERAVEILVSPWRDAEASKLDKAVAAIKARPADPATSTQDAADLKAASDAIDEYRGETQRYAFAVSLTISVLVSIAGVRALGPFADVGRLNDVKITTQAQHLFFLCVDVALSAGLLAGGADGIHSLVNAATSFFDGAATRSST
ncbi:MAG: hypothetical protein ABSH40_04835 [Bryobacteraceae bacterium]|jgi:hypothetical protein